MSCTCGGTSSSYDGSRRYMRIDDVIFDKKYVSKLVFYDNHFSLFFKGDCKEFKFPLSTPKTVNQIAEYQLELNSCGDQVDMSTDDHSKLINLDLEGQHPIAAVIGLQDALNNKVDETELTESLSTKQDAIEPVIYDELPSPESYVNKVYFCTDLNCLAYSDGYKWFKIKLESF